jgi:uncharacterized oxidoreductase
MLAGALTGGGASAPGRKFLYNNMLSVFIDATNTAQAATYAEEAQRFVAWVRSTAPAAGDAAVLLPGDRSRRMRAERAASGIPIDDVTAGKLAQAAARLAIEPLSTGESS